MATATRRRSVMLASPHHDDVVLVAGADLRLYALGAPTATLLHAHVEFDALRGAPRCAAWSPSGARPFLIAAGTSMGKMLLHDCTPHAGAFASDDVRPPDQRVSREFSLLADQRACNAISWSRVHTNLVLAGLDRARSGSCVVVWDVECQRAPVVELAAGHALGRPAALAPVAPFGGGGPSAVGVSALPASESAHGASIPRAASCAHLMPPSARGSAAATGAGSFKPAWQSSLDFEQTARLVMGRSAGGGAAAAGAAAAGAAAAGGRSAAGQPVPSGGIRPNASDTLLTQRALAAATPAALAAASGRPPLEALAGAAGQPLAPRTQSLQLFTLSEAGKVDVTNEPFAEFSTNEGAVSVGWLPQHPQSLLAGMSFKWLRMYDMRAPDWSSAIVAHNKGVYGLEFSTHNPQLVATYSDDGGGLVKVWDVRRLEDNCPAFALQLPVQAVGGRAARGDNVSAIAWCPTRQGCLATTQERSSDCHVWSMPHLIARANALVDETLQNASADAAAAARAAGRAAAAAAGGGGGGCGGGSGAGAAEEGSALSVAGSGSSGAAIGAAAPPPAASGGGERGGAGGTGGADGGKSAAESLGAWPTLSVPTRVLAAAEPASAMCWHPLLEAHLLLLAQRDSVVSMLPVHSARPFAWAPSHHTLVVAAGSALHTYSTAGGQGTLDAAAAAQPAPAAARLRAFAPLRALGARGPRGGGRVDVSERMRLRALGGYGLDVRANQVLVDAEADALARLHDDGADARPPSPSAEPRADAAEPAADDGDGERPAEATELPRLWRTIERLHARAGAASAAHDGAAPSAPDAPAGAASAGFFEVGVVELLAASDEPDALPAQAAAPLRLPAHTAAVLGLAHGGTARTPAARARAEPHGTPQPTPSPPSRFAPLRPPPAAVGLTPAGWRGGSLRASALPLQSPAPPSSEPLPPPVLGLGHAAAQGAPPTATPAAAAAAAAAAASPPPPPSAGAGAGASSPGELRGASGWSVGLWYYASEQRRLASALCGWPLADDSEAFEALVAAAEAAAEFERGATIALLHGDLPRAVLALRRGAGALQLGADERAAPGRADGGGALERSNQLQLVAMGLAGHPHAARKDALAAAGVGSPPLGPAQGASGLGAAHSTALLPAAAAAATAAPGSSARGAAAAAASGGGRAYCGDGGALAFALPVPSCGGGGGGGGARSPQLAASQVEGVDAAGAAAAALLSESLWEETARGLYAQVRSPHLRLILALLGGAAQPAAAVLRAALFERAGPCALPLDDALALACRFCALPELLGAARTLHETLAQRGELSGLLLTGIATAAGARLLQAYVDRTADVQTAALVGALATTVRGGAAHAPALGWLDAYRELLDRWRLWHERARLDGELRALGTELISVKPDILVRCGFCSAAVGGTFGLGDAQPRAVGPHAMARGGQRQAGMRSGAVQGRPKETRAMACPHCAKPLPRCAICLLHLGEGLGRQPGADGGAFEDWFAWCQTCHHGGHARHLSDWFASHVECPVSNCSCSCAQLDPTIAQAREVRQTAPSFDHCRNSNWT